MECKFCWQKLQKTENRPEIIETYWNVNKGGIGKTTTSDSGNNRNILECKWKSNTEHFLGDIRNNRNILECKSILLQTDHLPAPEIIETYWNVNFLEDANNKVFRDAK